MNPSISRRTFLKGSLTATGLTLAVSITPFGYRVLNASEAKRFAPNVWFQITPDNVVTISIPNSEMGQGVRTALSMIVADELDADWGQIRVQQAPAADPYQKPDLQFPDYCGKRKRKGVLRTPEKGRRCRPGHAG